MADATASAAGAALPQALARAPLTHADLSALVKSFAITTVGVCADQISEVGDKTFLTSAILAMRHPPRTVFWGSWCAMICMSTLSSMLGAVLPAVLSHRGALAVSAALFLGFGGVMLYQGLQMSGDELGEEWKETQDEIRAAEHEHELEAFPHALPTTYPTITPYPRTVTAPRHTVYARAHAFVRRACDVSFSPVFTQAFLLNFLGEWGDRSQITTMALAATHPVAIVAVGTSLAHLVCVAMAVTAGAILAARLSIRHCTSHGSPVTLSGAVLFLLFGCTSAYQAWHTRGN